MEKSFHISIIRKLVLLILGVTIICFAVTPKLIPTCATEIEKQSREEHSEDTNKDVKEYFVSYEAIVPVTQTHLSIDPVVIFNLFILEEKNFVSEVKLPFFVNVLRKILFSRIATPNAP